MKEGDGSVHVRVVDGIGGIDAAEWDRCAGVDNPFVSHAFLAALEESGSVAPRKGWRPLHLVARAGDSGPLIGVAPLYAKTHSYGEYVFDHAWANAFERAGRSYYPKLQSCVPFSPVPGPRMLVAPDAPAATGRALLRAIEELVAANVLSSAHVTFAHEDEAELHRSAGWLERHGIQYHWRNRGYGTFDDFLETLNSRKRKAIRRERREVAETSVRVLPLTGDEIRPHHWEAFHRLYLETADRKWGGGYLNRAFFELLGRTMGDKVLLVMCEDGGEWVGGALNLIGTDALYGRNWGADGRYPFLHFEACYYRALDWAITHGLERVEAGAQGEHKIQRGYLPVTTHSFHWIPDRGFSRAVADFLAGERALMVREKALLADKSPYRADTV